MRYFRNLLAVIILVVWVSLGSSCKKTSSCNTVSGLTATSVTNNSVTLNWNNVSNATYIIQYRVVGSSTWMNAVSIGNSLDLAGLTAGSNYEWQVKTVCNNSVSGYTASSTFSTSGSSVFAGNYTVKGTETDQNGNVTTRTYTMRIAVNPNYADSIYITNFAWQDTSFTASAFISGNQFTVPNFVRNGWQVNNCNGNVSGDSVFYSFSEYFTSQGVTISETGYEVGVR